MGAYVFISYRRERIDFARSIQAHLRSAGFKVWLDTDQLRAGDSWLRRDYPSLPEFRLPG